MSGRRRRGVDRNRRRAVVSGSSGRPTSAVPPVLGLDPPRRRRRGRVALGLGVLAFVGVATIVATRPTGSSDESDPGSSHLTVLDVPVELHAGRVDEETAVTTDAVADRSPRPPDGVVVNPSAATAGRDAGTLAIGCDADGPQERWSLPPGGSAAAQLVVGLGDDTPICLAGEGAVDATLEAIATITGTGLVEPGVRRVDGDVVAGLTPEAARGVGAASVATEIERLATPLAVADSRPGARTFDGEFAGTGLRPASSTWQIPVVRASEVQPTAAVVEITAESREFGELWVWSPERGNGPPAVPTLALDPGDGPDAATAIVPIDATGRVCVTTSAPAHVALAVVAWIEEPAGSITGAAVGGVDTSCPAQELFPHWLMVAIYGTDRSARLGVLGEQDPEAAAARLEEVAAPWREGDRPVLPAFELIATMATADPGPDGQHRLVSDPAFVQRYLDVARRHGFYLILDIQPGYADFLDEAKRYEEFLRQPDVGLALDPEWRTTPPNQPGGGHIGTVDAAEVNAVADWLAQLVAEEDLPEKLLVLHQFRPQMITNREAIVEPEGVAVVVHMDGFGTRGQKQQTWDTVRADPPWDNGLKLFFDEDVDIYEPAEVLAGAFDPPPVLITYQ